MILQQTPTHLNDGPKARAKKERVVTLALEEANPEEALDLIDSRRDRLEKSVLIALKRAPNDYQNAFCNISRNVRMIYAHAYQSHLWNKMVTQRLRRYGNR